MEEYIKRKDALDVFSKHMFAGYRGNGKSFFSEFVMPTFYCAIEDLPSADVVEVKYGKWIQAPDLWDGIDLLKNYECSLCGKNHFMESNFCPNCGADMRGETNG